MQQDGESLARVPMMLLNFFNWSNHSRPTRPCGSKRNENQKQNKKFLESRTRPVRRTDKIISIM
jgi:hypothetical protein